MTILSTRLELPCGAEIKNRLCKAAMTERFADGNNFANDKHLNLYDRWGQGNLGLILTGNVQVDRRFVEAAGNVVIEEKDYQEQMPFLKRWVEAGTQDGAQLWMQLSHAGRQTPGEINARPFAPSSVPLRIPGRKFGVPIAMTHDDIKDLIQRFVVAGNVAREAGFTGVQIHAAHGYLLSEFLSPDINSRDDEWGGSLENRARLLLEIIKACRRSLGDDFPISVKLNSADFQRGGFSSHDSLGVAAMLDAAGVDLLEISGGTYEQPKLLGYDDISVNPKRSEARRRSTIAREAFFLAYAEEIAGVVDAPLMVTGGFRSRPAMEGALREGACQLIGIARPLCVNPFAARKLLAREIDVLPRFEKTLSLGPGWLSSSSPFRIVQALNAFSTQAWFYMQIRRMGDGLDPDLALTPFAALRQDTKLDAASVAAYKACGSP